MIEAIITVAVVVGAVVVLLGMLGEEAGTFPIDDNWYK